MSHGLSPVENARHMLGVAHSDTTFVLECDRPEPRTVDPAQTTSHPTILCGVGIVTRHIDAVKARRPVERDGYVIARPSRAMSSAGRSPIGAIASSVTPAPA